MEVAAEVAAEVVECPRRRQLEVPEAEEEAEEAVAAVEEKLVLSPLHRSVGNEREQVVVGEGEEEEEEEEPMIHPQSVENETEQAAAVEEEEEEEEGAGATNYS